MPVFLNLILYTTVWTLFSTCVEISCKEVCICENTAMSVALTVVNLELLLRTIYLHKLDR